MGQKTHPTGFRVGIIQPWFSTWFAGKNYPEFVAEDNKILGTLPLPIGGLMTNLSAHETADALAELEIRAGELGVKISHPFMALSFLCLSVIPELRITDQGYVDITKGGIQPLFVQ